MKYTFYFILSLLLLSSCSGRHTKHTKKFLIDSLTSVVYDLMGDEPERAMSLVDSLEREGVYSSAMANCRRAQIASEQYEPRQSEVYALRALKDPNLNDEREDIRYFIYNLLINAATNVGNTEQALKYSVEATTLAKADTAKVARLYLPDFLVCIGCCQFKLNRHREGNENFDRAWASYEELLVDAKSFTWFYPAFMLCVDAVNNNVSSDSITLAMRWQPRLQKIYEQTVTAKDIPDHVKDDCTADMEIALAKLFAAAGQRAEAEKHFAVFRETAFSQTAIGQKYSSAYLEQMGRWRELAATMENADTFFVNNQSQYTSDYLQNVLARKFNAQMRLHNHEAALQTASRLVALLDTVQELERKDDAAKLAVIYETQEKEQKIAQQQADLTQQRLVAVIVAFVLMVVFFVVYTLNRRAAARRLAKVTAQKERIESELRIARDIQMSMVPNSCPQYEGVDLYALMTPAREVGGDLYDYLLQDGSLYFCVGDVSGKGVPASLFMAQVIRLFRAFAKRGYKPAEIACRINDELTENNESGMFVTLFMGLVRLSDGHLDYCNCGHNPPVVGGEFLEMESNAPIGLFPGVEFVGEEIASIQHQVFFVYTDGLNEAEDNRQEQFGDERLLATLRQAPQHDSRQLIETLEKTIAQHRKGAEPNDDLTMLCLRLG
jgi:hypothetical protein